MSLLDLFANNSRGKGKVNNWSYDQNDKGEIAIRFAVIVDRYCEGLPLSDEDYDEVEPTRVIATVKIDPHNDDKAEKSLQTLGNLLGKHWTEVEPEKFKVEEEGAYELDGKPVTLRFSHYKPEADKPAILTSFFVFANPKNKPVSPVVSEQLARLRQRYKDQMTQEKSEAF